MHIPIGNLIMTGVPGFEVCDSTRQLVSELGINHFIIFKRNVKDASQLTTLCHDLSELCLAHDLNEPLIAIDQEGGTVTRLPLPFTQFADAREYGDHPEAAEKVTSYARRCAADLLRCGINMNFAPVLDVCPAQQGCFMEKRAYGADPQQVANLAERIINTLQELGIAACGKHFPGLGEGVIDPHLQLPTVGKSAAAIKAHDLIPFQQAMAAGVAAIMTSHVIYTDLDPNNLATMSTTILTGMLRQELGYDGLLVTDDLEMGAIENDISVPQAALRALQAGADLLLICHDHDKVRQTHKLIAEKRAEGIVPKARLAAADRRIRQLCHTYARQQI